MKKFYLLIIISHLFTFGYSQTTRHVNSVTGNDANAGTIGDPYKTFHRAYTVAASGDIISLTGTFDWSATDETGYANEFQEWTTSQSATALTVLNATAHKGLLTWSTTATTWTGSYRT